MTKTDKQKRRKNERLRRSKAWESEMRQRQQHDFLGDFERLRRQELERHPSLLGIEVFQVNERLPDPEDAAFIAHFGYEGYALHRWDPSSDEEYSSQMQHSDGGFVQTLLRENHTPRTVVFIKTRPGNQWALALINIAVLYHEIGHVDDIEHEINLRVGEHVDLMKAELYAHKYACKRLLEENQRGPLAYYLTDMIDQLANSDAPLVKTAAIEFSNSREYERYRMQNRALVESFGS